MKGDAVCIIPNCGRSTPPREAFCSAHRDRDGDDYLSDMIKDAFVAGCVEMLQWLHAAVPRDDLDEAGYDYADSVLRGRK